MKSRTVQLADMQSLSLLVLLVAAASAVDNVKKDDKVAYHCSLHASDHGIVLKERKFPIYLCNSDDGDRIIVASETLRDDKVDAIVDKDTFLMLRGLTRPKRQYLGSGFGGAGASSQAGAVGGGFGGGGFGYPPNYGGGAGFGGSYSSSQAGALGGGGGFGK